ncbi:translation initiation factor IF-2-like isoform X2 [Zalophus californianus]|uniref:Translation initiation factor IF-2-like isoform X2 n=1 Tax=Zalophus californianus TaxID=9704 RepID=A0A6J2D375_ZALCA|nr:translation initiation factor IF-2-like isoform X2 [Zalophus californianus]
MSGRAAAGPALSPRPPARRRPLCRARAAGPPRGRPEPARSPQRARRPGSASWGPRLPPAREARELGESRGVRRPGPPRQGVDAPGPARFRFRPGQRSLEALVADAESGFGRPLLGEVRWFHTGELESGEEERRGAGPGEWGLAVRFARLSLRPGAVRPGEELREMAPRCTLRFTRVKEGSVRDPGLRPMAQGLWRVGTIAQRCLRPGAFLRQGQGSRPACPGSRSGSGRLLRMNMTHPRAPPRKRDLPWPSGDIPGLQSPGLTPSSCLLVLQGTPATLPPSAPWVPADRRAALFFRSWCAQA